MSCIKHHTKIVYFCQSCNVFVCENCPPHKYHILIDYSLYLSQCKSEIQAFSKTLQSKEKLLEMLNMRILGYFASIDKNRLNSLDSIKSSYEALHKCLLSKKETLIEEIEKTIEKFHKPLLHYTEKIKSYLLEIKHQVARSESIIEKISEPGSQDPILISNEMKKLSISEFHYIESFIISCKKSLEEKVPIVPIAEKNLSMIEGSLFLDFNSAHLEIKPLFPYWNIDRLLSNLKLKDQGSSIASKSDSWATAIFNETFSCGKATVEFLIVKDASASKMYIGVVNSNTPGLNLTKAFSSTCGYQVWAYRICGEMHSKSFCYSKFKDKRRFHRGDKIKMEIDLDRMGLSFFRNGEEIYTFVDIAESVRPFVSFGESFQTVQVIACETSNPKVIFH